MAKGKRAAKKIQQEEEVEDIMAWGNRRDNFYQAGEDQYSQSGEEEAEAQRIYEKQLEEMEGNDLYDLPEEEASQQEQQEQEEEEIQENTLSHSYLTKQIARVAKMGLKISEEADSKLRRALETQLQVYLMALIGLRELKIPYIEHHPLFNKVIEMKQDISQLKRLFDVSTVHEQTGQGEEDIEDELEGQYDEEEQEDQEKEEDPSSQNEVAKKVKKNVGTRETPQNIKKGLKIYEEAKRRQDEAKTAAKQQKKREREASKKPAFLEVKEDQGRLASEKILKNKGLIKKRKKIDRNSRVKLRRKFDKAASKRRAYGHVIRSNPGLNYQGEKNIRYGRIASVKLK